MTVSSSTSKVSYSGNGSLTVFAYTFKIFDEDDLTVILRASDGTETTQTITTHYTVSGVGSAGGGNVTFVTAPASGVTVVILREQPLTQELDLVPNDPFPAQSLEESLDKLVFMVQAHSEELDRAIKASKTNVINGSEFTISAADRANKIFAFDSSGDVSITQEIGVYRGNWATSTAYNQRDIVKDTSNNNIYICNTAHTSSGSTPISSNADTAKWYLLVDAASATAAQTAAEAAQTAAETAQTAAETAQTAAETAETNAETAQTAAEAAQAAAELAYDNFDDRYLGAKASDPATDNDGNALITGALYFNTTSGMKVYDGSAWDDVKPTAAEQTNIDAVAADATDIGTVATNIANVNTVAGISGNVTTVAGISADVTTVAADGTDIGTVATNISNVNTVAGISANVTTVAGISANVTTVAGISANVTTVAGDTANIGTIATNLTGTDTIGTVAGSISNVNSVGGSIANVNTVATNISSVNSFAETYRIGATDPTTSLDTGDLFFNTSSGILKVYNGSAWEAGVTAGSGFMPTTGGSFTGDVSFGDNVKAQFGASADLQIYHDGTHSRVNNSTGDLFLQSPTVVRITNSTASETAAKFFENGAVELYHDNSKKFNTTSTGIDVTGTVTADGLTVAASTALIKLEDTDTNAYAQIATDGSGIVNIAADEGSTGASPRITFDISTTERMRIDSSGNVGIGTTSPAYTLDVAGEMIADSYNETYAAVTSSTNATTVDCEAGNAFSHTLTENTTFTFSNPPASGTAFSFSIEIIQDASASGFTVTWPTSVDWPAATAPTLTATASAKDVFVFYTRDGGTNWLGFTAGQALG